MTKKNNANIALSVALVFVALLAGYVVFVVMQKAPEQGGASSVPPVVKPSSGKKLIDMVFVIDATSSMADEIEQVKAEVVEVADSLAKERSDAKIRYGLVLYKDTTDDFLVEQTPLTSDAQKIRQLLQNIEVSGGGDYPEHVGAGLHDALRMAWNQDAEKVIYLVGDAPGHEYQDGKEIESAIQNAQKRGIMIRALGCSGIDSQGGAGKRQFQRIASMTNGNYRDLTYHAIVEGADGRKRSVIYEGGEAYEADRVLEDKEWAAGAKDLKGRGLVAPAKAETKRRATGAKKKSNAIEIISGDF